MTQSTNPSTFAVTLAALSAQSESRNVYLTLAQYAEAVGKSPRTIQRWLDSGAITSDLKLPGRTGQHLFKAERVQADRVRLMGGAE